MDEATHEFFASAGMPMSELYKNEHICFPLLEASCTFKTPLYFEDEVCITTTMEIIKSKVFSAKHIFTRGDQLIAEGCEVRAWANFENGSPKAVEISEEVKKRIFY